MSPQPYVFYGARRLILRSSGIWHRVRRFGSIYCGYLSGQRIALRKLGSPSCSAAWISTHTSQYSHRSNVLDLIKIILKTKHWDGWTGGRADGRASSPPLHSLTLFCWLCTQIAIELKEKPPFEASVLWTSARMGCALPKPGASGSSTRCVML
jgi:hypothetical protein